jgi:hypothetical protein
MTVSNGSCTEIQGEITRRPYPLVLTRRTCPPKTTEWHQKKGSGQVEGEGGMYVELKKAVGAEVGGDG